MNPDASIASLEVGAYRVPTDQPESDGTLAWDSTTLVVVHASAGGVTGLGYTYADGATARLAAHTLSDVVEGRDPMDIPAAWRAMLHAIRNLGRPGIASMAMAAVDCALWDLKARMLDVPLVALLGAARESVPVYGSGGFTSYSEERLCEQLAGWVAEGLPAVKMKVGRDPAADPRRVRAARRAIGDEAALFVDANGAWSRAAALGMIETMADESGVSWVEEPVSSDDLEGLHLLRDRAPGGVEVAAGEYGYDIWYYRRMLEAGAVHCVQADVTRCGGFTGFLRVASVAQAFQIPLSAHCAPQQSAHACCAAPGVRHLEYFHDHVRIERRLLDGALVPEQGVLRPDRARPGMGVTFKRQDAEPYRIG